MTPVPVSLLPGYGALWTGWWFSVLAVSMAWAGLVLPLSGVVGAWLLGIALTYVVRLAVVDEVNNPGGERRNWDERAAWAGMTSVAAVVVSTRWPGGGVVLATAVAGTSPAAVDWIRGHWVMSHAHGPAPTAASVLGGLTSGELDGLWRTSERHLRSCVTTEDVLLVVRRREQLLDELYRRSDAGLLPRARLE